MGSCNVVQNEIGGKELLLKACQDRLASTIGGVKAALTIQGIILTAVNKGILGNSITIALVDPAGNSQPLSVSVVGNAITVSLATSGGGAITSTAAQVIAAIVASTPASALVVATGSGAIALTAAAATPLTGGVDGSTIVVTQAVSAKVGDIVRFNDVGTLTSVIVGKFYAVVEAVSSTSFKVSNVLGGDAIQMDATETGLSVDVFSTLGGLRSKSFGFASEAVDITNGDSDEWKTILDKAGQRSFTVSGSGVYTNETIFQKAEADAIANLLSCLMFIEVKTGRIYNGCFKITSLEISGDYNAESAYSISAESSGTIEIVKLV